MVSVRFEGRLGNNLIQYLVAKLFARKNNLFLKLEPHIENFSCIKKLNNENPKKFQNHQTKTFTKVITKKIIINEEKSSDESQEILEIGLLCDCTSSMKDWIERAKETLN